MSDRLGAWLSRRTLAPPSAFDPWSDEEEGEEGVVDALTAAGVRELRQAVSRPGRVRESAFHLLAADGFLTYACEAAAESEDVVDALENVLASSAGAGS